MRAFSIHGGTPLVGEVTISGAKNSALPILAACVVAGDTYCIHNCPDITDVAVEISILQELGCSVVRSGQTLRLDTRTLRGGEVPQDLAARMRASILFLGALYARLGEVTICQPGGCRLGERPIDLHLQALRALGAQIECTGDCICCRRQDGGDGYIRFRYPSVGATENALLAAVGSPRDSILHNCAREPEICDLADFLRACGAEISGDGSETIFVRGGRVLHGAEHRVIPDRMETVSFLCAAAGCGGEVTLRAARPAHCRTECELLRSAGCELETAEETIHLLAPERLRALPLLATGPYPRFSTDAQPLMMAALLRAQGVSRICETVFENRFRHVSELRRLGASITLTGRYARIEGGRPLRGCRMQAEDLRGAAALTIAALMAQGESELLGLEHLTRGYCNFAGKLQGLGASISEIECEP